MGKKIIRKPLWNWIPIATVAATAFLLLAQPEAALSATLTIQANAPVPGTDDVYNFSGAFRDGVNVTSNGVVYADGAANDAFTYVAGDRVSQGQTFTTGTGTNIYTLRAVWLRHAGYTNNTQLTYWRMSGGVSLVARVTDPSQAGSAGFALATETYTTTGAEGWPTISTSSTNGTGSWLKFALTTPIALQSNKTYGFDVTSSSTTVFFECLGTSNVVYSGGSAYNGSTKGVPDNTLKLLTGDRVFLVELAAGAQTNSPATTNSVAYAEPLTVADDFPLNRVRLLDSRFKQNQDFHRTNYLTWIAPDRLLYPFRANAGLSNPVGVTSLGGWEGSSGFTAVRGHIGGHYLSAASRMYAATGDTNFLPKIQYLVQELRKCQNALSTNEIAAGRPYGYLSAFPSSYFDVLETNPLSGQVPFYTIHKIMAGLVDAYRYTSNDLALDMAINMSDYHAWRMTRLTSAQIETMFVASTGHTEWGGMNETLTDLYLLSQARGDTNAARHLAFAEVFHRDWFVNPLAADLDQLNGLHANTHIPQVVGFARVASVLNTNDVQRDRLYAAADNFWHIVLGSHWLALGGNSYSEHFSTAGKETGVGGSALSWSTAETCNTYNMLKLTRQLFMHNPAAEYGDYYEHALYDHILASFAPDTGMMTYFVPMVSGHFKTYCQPEGSSWCCQGTGMENPARYNEGIYFHKNAVLWVNLFIPSTLDWSERGLTVTLQTGFPLTNTVSLTMQCAQPTNAALRIRIPSWIASTPTVKINGADQGLSPVAGSYLELNRTWTNGDTIKLTLPIKLIVDHSMDDPTQSSLFYGPILLAADLGTNGMPVSDEAVGQGDYSAVADVAAPALIGDNANNPTSWVQPDGGPLEFQAVSAYPGDNSRSVVHLRPFYDVHHTRYAVYMNLIAPANFCLWSGGAASSNWTASANWNVLPASQSAVQFGLPAGGGTTNDLASDTVINGIQFLAGAGSFRLGGNRIVLRGDVVNQSASPQDISLPIQLNGYVWNFDASAGDLVLGGGISGTGGINKLGAHTLTVTSNFTVSGAVEVSEGLMQIGNGSSTGSLGNTKVMLDVGASLAFNRSDTFLVANSISGGGGLINRGTGTMQLATTISNTGPMVVEAGTLQITSQAMPMLSHRWSFNGSLNDSVGTNSAVVIDVGANNTTLTSSAITLAGGTQATSDYVSLGGNLLPKDGSPATIELWASQMGAQSWSRIFDVGSATSENLMMAWSQGTDTTKDRVEWKDAVTSTVDNSDAPYTVGTEFHVAMVIEPGAGSGGTTRVTWYSAATNAAFGTARGTFDTANTLTGLNDSNFWLGRSEYADSTANARYNEARLWTRAFSPAELQQLHALGPDSVGSFAVVTNTGKLCPQSDLVLQAGAQFNAAGTTQQVASLSGSSGSVINLGGGQLNIGTGGNPAATFAGAFVGGGSIQVNGVLRLVGNASFPAGITFTNHGTLDIMTWNGTLPTGFVNYGTVLDRSVLKVDACQVTNTDFTLIMHGFPGHTYQLQYCDDLGTGGWQNVSSPVNGTDAAINLTHSGGAAGVKRFYRVSISP